MFVHTHYLSILHKLPNGHKLQVLQIQIIDLYQNEVTYDIQVIMTKTNQLLGEFRMNLLECKNTYSMLRQ